MNDAELIQADPEDIELIMRELLKENPEFAEVDEEIRSRVVIQAVYEVLAQRNSRRL